MKQYQENGIEWHGFDILESMENIIQFTTTRRGGYSSGAVTGLNLSKKVDSDANNVDKNIALLQKSLGLGDARIILPDQSHTANIVVVTNDTKSTDLLDTDAIITAIPNICIGVITADCVPILLYDDRKHVCAAIHAGWRGTVANILSDTAMKMITTWGCDPKNIYAAIGPSICSTEYEVGTDVIQKISAYGDAYAAYLLPHPNPDKKYIDLQGMNKKQLTDINIPDKNIQIANVCTVKQNNLYYSYRKEKLASGRFITGIMMK